MLEQINHLAAISEWPNVLLGVVPWGCRVPHLPLNSFAIFDDRLVIVGTHTRLAYITVRADLDTYRALFDEMARFAEYGDNARAILERVADRYRGMA
jgi:hypothetical protein